MHYCKLINGRLQYAPKKITNNNTTVYNPTASMLIADGWKPLVVTDQPASPTGYHLEPIYSETSDSITQDWTVVADPPEEPTLEEQVEAQAEAIEELAMLIAEVLG